MPRQKEMRMRSEIVDVVVPLDTSGWLSLPDELRRAARDAGDQVFLTIGGRSYTFAEAWERSSAVAAGLRSQGLRPGDRVAILAPNRAEAVWTWFGSLIAGCVDVPLNAESRGSQLAYFVSDSGPRVLVGTPELLDGMRAAEGMLPEVVVVLDVDVAPEILGNGTRYLTWSQLIGGGAPVDEEWASTRPGLLASIVYTSGTTGPSKGVMWAHGYYPSTARLYATWAGFDEGLSFYSAQPLYHLDGRAAVVVAVYLRGRATLAARFSASRFWTDVENARANAFGFIGTMLQLLAKQPGRGRPADAPLLVGMGTAIPANAQLELEERFSVRLLEGYGTTEIPLILACRRDARTTGTVGTPADGMQVVLVDDDDAPVPLGEPGLLCVRPEVPFSVTLGYWNKPEATAETFTNLWFHTGDLLRELEDGSGFEYVGRLKDSIRRRGENISAWEVEQAGLEHTDVLECAAIGVPSEVGDEDVALLVVLREGAAVAAGDLVDFMVERLPRFAAPRYVEIVDSLPKTPSERISKAEVRERGLTAAAVDLQPPR
jgi:crotonobetaine/carnitine-CoA ligase